MRVSRQRPAPSALRTDSSPARASPRASIMLATLTQAISSTIATRAIITPLNKVNSRAMSFGKAPSGSAFMVWSGRASPGSGLALLKASQRARSSSRACSRVAPGLSRAPLSSQLAPTTSSRSPFDGCTWRCIDSGTYRSGDSSETWLRKSRLATPITVNDWPFKVMVRPTTSASPPKYFCQAAWLMTACGLAPRLASACGDSRRPRSACTPSRSK